MASSTISLCQSSIHSILSNIPSQASELAVNVVNNFLEDQVADPVTFQRNISRVKSVFSGCHTGRGDGGGDCPNHETKCLLTIPRKIRQNIWNYLDDRSIKALRLVCCQLRHEMDFDVGLAVVLTNASFNNPWIQSISIRSCTVNEMQAPILLNRLARPEKLEKIRFAPELDISPEMIELVIRKFRNLRQLIIYTEDVVELKNVGEEAISSGTSSKLMTRLDEQFELTAVDIKFDTTKWKLKWNVKLKPQTLDKYWEVKDVIGPFGLSGIARFPVGRDLSRKSLKMITLSIPFVQGRDRYVWLGVLQRQNALTSFTCDLNATHWKDYESIIKANDKTLRKLFLLNITNSSCMRWEGNMPFDWKMFEECQAIEEITLIADAFMYSSCLTTRSESRRHMDIVNLSTLKSCPALRALWLENFKLTDEDFSFLKNGEGSPETARFDLCTLKNCIVDSEEVSERHVGRAKKRNRSLECLCFGTNSYDDDDLQNFENKYTNSSLTPGSKNISMIDWDMIECFQNTCTSFEQEENDRPNEILNKVNLIGAIAFTAWLWWC